MIDARPVETLFVFLGFRFSADGTGAGPVRQNEICSQFCINGLLNG